MNDYIRGADEGRAEPDRIQRRVEFRDTDAAGIAHFSTYFNYMEEAEHTFLRRRGLSVFMRDAEGAISWPRVAAKCDYSSAVKFEDVVTIEVTLARIGAKSVTFLFHFLNHGREVAKGEITAVCCRIEPDQPPKGIAIPAEIRAKLTSHPKK
ncbi:MAG: acyl-CoA thioesterase [Planctomycetia bacterium]|nr:acyl-CoA thioesterase [Planctomycetia bacterium]